MAIGAIIGGVASLAGGLLGSDSADKAAGAGVAAEMAKLRLARENRDIGLAINKPGMQAGVTALAGMMDMAGLSRAAIPGTGGGAPGAGSDGTPGPQPGVRPPGTPGGYLADGRTYLPAKPQEFQGSDAEWATMYQAYLANPGDFVNKGGKYYDTPAAVIGATPDAQRGLYGRSGKVWGQLMAGLQRGTSGDNAPFNMDTLGVPSLAGVPAYNWKADPGYQFRIDEGMRGLENSAAARGGLLSGGFARAVTEYGQNMASQEYGNVFNRLASIAGYGQTANAGGQNAITNYGGAAADAIGGAGGYRASGYIGQANSWATAINQLGELAGNWGNYGGGGSSNLAAGGSAANRYGGP